MPILNPGRPTAQPVDGEPHTIDNRGSIGSQFGDNNRQIFYVYGNQTWSNKVAPPPLVSVSGEVDSPYRGLGAFDEQDAPFFFGREEAATKVLGLMSEHVHGSGLIAVSGVSGAGKSRFCKRVCCRGFAVLGWRTYLRLRAGHACSSPQALTHWVSSRWWWRSWPESTRIAFGAGLTLIPPGSRSRCGRPRGHNQAVRRRRRPGGQPG